LTRLFLTGTSYTDTAAPAGSKIYMVRAVKLETTASGTYYNPSQGAFASVDSGGGPALPTVRIDAATPTGSEEGPKEAGFVVTRSGGSGADLTVNFAIAGSAGNGGDYERISSSVTVQANSNDAWISIWPIPDSLVEGDESVILTLSPSAAYVLGSPNSATVTIKDTIVNQPPTISSIPDVTVTVGNPPGPVAFVIGDAETAADNLTVTTASSNTTLLPSGNLVPGGAGTNRTLTMTPATNQTGNATITVTVSDGKASTARSFQLTVLVAPARPAIAWQGDGSVLLQFKGTPGGAYSVHTSKDLITWSATTSGTFGADGWTSYQDHPPQTDACLFYRIQRQ
jgi:hypothetical protein